MSHQDLNSFSQPGLLQSKHNLQFHSSLGFASHKRNNLHFLAENLLIYAVGNSIVLFDTITLSKRSIFGFGRGGVGAVCVRMVLIWSEYSHDTVIQVHPSHEFFAVGEKGNSPNIYIYHYPSLSVRHVLRKGTERAFCDLEFEYDTSPPFERHSDRRAFSPQAAPLVISWPALAPRQIFC